jgi:hypothetical protein
MRQRAAASVLSGEKELSMRTILLRLDFRDYISPFPEELFVTAQGAKIHGWLHDFVPLGGISWVF